MKFKLDENLPLEATTLFRANGFDADHVRDENLDGSDDDIVFHVCQHEQRILITHDLDFSDIHQFPPASSGGVIVLRLSLPSKKHTLKMLARIVQTLQSESVLGRLWIVDESRIRVRGDL